MKTVDFLKETTKNDKSSIRLIFTIAILIFIGYVLGLILYDQYNINEFISEYYIKIIINVLLSVMGVISCLLSYNSNKKDEVFIMSLMYVAFVIDILSSRATGYLHNPTSQYYALLTSLVRVMIVYISVSNLNKLKKIIVNNKINSFIVVILASILCIYIEYFYMMPYKSQTVEFYSHYNITLIVLYTYIAFKYFKNSFTQNEYIYGVIGTSALLFSVKSIYDHYNLININKYFNGNSAIILGFTVYIIGLFLELKKSTKTNKVLDEQRSLFIKIIDENRHSNIVVCDENYYINYKNLKAKQSLEEVRQDIDFNPEIGERLELEKIFKGDISIDKIESEIKLNNNYKQSIYLKDEETILDLSIDLFEINNRKFKVVVIKDNSLKYKLEKTLLDYELVKKEEIVKNEFFSNISHELKTPLNVLYSTNQLLDKSISRDDFKEIYVRYSEGININCKRMLRLIDNIVDITKLDVGYKQPNFKNYDIVNVVEDMTLSIVNYANTKDIDIIFDTDIEELTIKFDLDMLERIILNLLSNAIKFSKEGSTVLVKVLCNREWVAIKVIDDGIGIDKDIQSKIFERFVQGDKSIRRQKEGSGIGLSLVKSFVELMDGKVFVKSDGENGSEFTVLLPNKVLIDNNNDTYTSYIVDEERVQLEFSDIYELYDE